MNTKLMCTAEGVIDAAMRQGRTVPALIAEALESARLLQSPETAAEFERLRAERDKALAQRNAVFATNEQLHAQVEEAGLARIQAENETRTAKREAEKLRGRVAELEESPLAWAEKLDAKSLDNFLIALSTATEYEPMDGAIDEIHQLIRSYRKDESAEPYVSRPLPPRHANCARSGCGHPGEFHQHGDTKCWAHLPKRHGDPVTICDCPGFVAEDDVTPQVLRLRALRAGQREQTGGDR